MCMKRDEDYNLRDMCNSWIIDVTLEDLVEIEDTLENPLNEQWNYPYNLLPSSDEEELPRDFIVIDHMENSNDDHIESDTTSYDSLNEVNQNTVEGINGQLNEGQEFEMNIPLILLSMSRISNNLFERAAAFRD